MRLLLLCFDLCLLVVTRRKLCARRKLAESFFFRCYFSIISSSLLSVPLSRQWAIKKVNNIQQQQQQPHPFDHMQLPPIFSLPYLTPFLFDIQWAMRTNEQKKSTYIRSSYRKKKRKHVRRTQSQTDFETRTVTAANKRHLFR
jgi:hypothetical protein